MGYEVCHSSISDTFLLTTFLQYKNTRGVNAQFIIGMEAKVKWLPLLALLVLFCTAGFERVNGAGECGSVSADTMAFQMAPCASASQDVNAAVSASCCSAVQKIGQNPKCLCAVMLSNTAKSAGVSPIIAVTIPKRCRIENRPVGYKCGGYNLP